MEEVDAFALGRAALQRLAFPVGSQAHGGYRQASLLLGTPVLKYLGGGIDSRHLLRSQGWLTKHFQLFLLS